MKEKKENKKAIYIVILVAIVLIIILLFFLMRNNDTVNTANNLKCNIENTLMEGFNNKEEITFNVADNQIKRIKYERTITLTDIYKEDETYLDSLNTSLENAYNYLKKYDIKKNKDNIKISIDTKEKGIILNNLSIKKNNEEEDTSIRFDSLADIDKDENAFKIGDKYNKDSLKKKVEEAGYQCNE